MKSKKKILIFGSSGHVASNLISTACESNLVYSVTRSDLKKKKLIKKYPKSYFFTTHELKKISDYNFETLIFCAGPNDITCNKFKELGITNYLKYIFKILEKIKNFHFKKIIFLSTAQVYHLKGKVNESSSTSPLNFYGLNRLMTENIFRYYSKIRKIPLVILRASNIVGDAHFDKNNSKRLVPNQLCDILVKENNFKLMSDGMGYRNFISMNDVIDCIMFFIKKKLTNKIFVFNLSYKNMTIYRFSVMLAKIFSNISQDKKKILKGTTITKQTNKLFYSDLRLKKFGFKKRSRLDAIITDMYYGRIR